MLLHSAGGSSGRGLSIWGNPREKFLQGVELSLRIVINASHSAVDRNMHVATRSQV